MVDSRWILPHTVMFSDSFLDVIWMDSGVLCSFHLVKLLYSWYLRFFCNKYIGLSI